MKFAKEINELDKLRIEGESVDADEKNTDYNKSSNEVFDEGVDTVERVMTLHTEMCEKSEVTSAEEGHDVDVLHAPQSDETADILIQSKRNERGFDGVQEEGVGRKPITRVS